MVTGFPTSAPDGRWSEGSTGRFICRLPATRPTRALIATGALVTENHAQRMTVSVNKGVPHEFRYTHDSRAQTVSLPVPQDGSLELELVFTFPDAISPRELGLNSDPRQLAVFISHIRFE